jgi:flagellar protein FliS
MTSNPYQKASQAYLKHRDENLTPLQIVVELYRGMIKNIRQAKFAWEEKRLDAMTNNIIKTFNIIEALQINLDLENGGEDAKFLNNFYNTIFNALSRASSKPDPAAEFDAIISYVQQVHDRWYVVAYGRPPEVPSAESADFSETTEKVS